MATTINDQTEEIEQFLIETTETEEYKSVEYLVFSIYKPMLDYFTSLRNKDANCKCKLDTCGRNYTIIATVSVGASDSTGTGAAAAGQAA